MGESETRITGERKIGRGGKEKAKKSGRQGWVLPAAALLVVVVVGSDEGEVIIGRHCW